MIPFRYQLLGHLAVALLLTLLLNAALTQGPTEVEAKATPFTTQPEMLAVTVVAYPEAPPKIVAVEALAQGRVSVTQPGPYSLTLEDEAGQPLHTISFRVSFVLPGLPEALDESRQVFVMPDGEEADRLVLVGPQGEDAWVLGSEQPAE
ncbi:MAG: hypothetical protein RQ748_13015 [Elusimicrobiales bacterium]|nr:hypothetical protein [Elusimicrobiales bacterium]